MNNRKNSAFFDEDLGARKTNPDVPQPKGPIGAKPYNDSIVSTFIISDISFELWREYVWGRECNIYRINNPNLLYTKKDSNYHRVVDSYGVTHLVPTPGHLGCVVRWKSRDNCSKVMF